jgi:hypothetical protein
MPTWNDIRQTSNLRGEHNLRGKRSQAIQSQYSASPKLLGLAKAFQLHLDLSPDVDLFYKKMFDIYTAEGEGLDNWGRILNIGRIISDENVILTLSDDMYRLLLLYKALANISASSPDSLNVLLDALCKTEAANLPKSAYVLEVGPMVIRWVFEAYLNEEQLAVFKAAGTLARGAGVGWELYAITPYEVFGFDGSGLQPFNQAPFAPDNALIVNTNRSS